VVQVVCWCIECQGTLLALLLKRHNQTCALVSVIVFYKNYSVVEYYIHKSTGWEHFKSISIKGFGGSIVVKALCYKLEDRGFETR
jgi:hypothetical protein